MSYQSALTICDVVKEINSKKYVLPSIQREFVWSTYQIERLFDSLMQDYPISSFLFWRISKEKYKDYEFYEFLRNYHEKNNKHNPKANLSGEEDVIGVLDGQQRLTSIYIGLKGSYAYKIPYKKWNNENAFPKRKLYLNLVSKSEDDDVMYDFEFLTQEEAENNENEYWFEVGKILDMTELEHVNEFLFNEIVDCYSKEQRSFANKAMSQLYKVIHTKPTISYYLEKSEELDKVLNIFIRINSGGAILSYSDLLLSIASAQWETLDAREEIIEFVDEINEIGDGFNINKDFVLKAALVLSDLKNIAFKVDNFNKNNMLHIEKEWNNIKKAISLAVKLVASFGYSRETLASNNALIPIAYYLKNIGLPENYESSTLTIDDRSKVKKWLVLSLLKKVFGGQPDNIIKIIRDIIKEEGSKGFPLEKIIKKFKGTNKTLIFTEEDIVDNLLCLKYGNSDTLSTLSLLYPSFDFRNKFHIDHIFPKSKFKAKILIEKGVAEEKIDDCLDYYNYIGNLQLLPAIPNIEKQDKDFAEWFEKANKTNDEKQQYKKIHYIPNVDLSYNNFIEFVDERDKLLKSALEICLKV